MFDTECNSPVCRNRIKNCLESLKVREFEATGLDVSAFFSEVYTLIVKLSRHMPSLTARIPIVLSFHIKRYYRTLGHLNISSGERLAICHFSNYKRSSTHHFSSTRRPVWNQFLEMPQTLKCLKNRTPLKFNTVDRDAKKIP